MKKLLFAALPFLLASPVAAQPQNAVLGVRGCGTGCRFETVQLSEPAIMADGWVKVLEEQAMYVVDMNGHEERFFRGQRMPIRDRHWVFAKCGDRWFGTGYRSDGQDAAVQSIYDENGNPISYTAGGNIYDRHEVLCKAAGLQ